MLKQTKNSFAGFVTGSVVVILFACLLALISQWGKPQFGSVLVTTLSIIPNLLLVLATARYVIINQKSLEQAKQASDRLTPKPVIEVVGSQSKLVPGKPIFESNDQFTFSVLCRLQISNPSPAAQNCVWIQNAKVSDHKGIRAALAVFRDENDEQIQILTLGQGETVIRTAEVLFGYELSDGLTNHQNTVVELCINDSYGHEDTYFVPVKVNGKV